MDAKTDHELIHDAEDTICRLRKDISDIRTEKCKCKYDYLAGRTICRDKEKISFLRQRLKWLYRENPLPILITSQYYQCPKCKLRLYDRLYNNDKEYLITNYCPNCGQRLETIGKTRKYYKEHEKELEEKDKKYIDKLFKEEDGV